MKAVIAAVLLLALYGCQSASTEDAPTKASAPSQVSIAPNPWRPNERIEHTNLIGKTYALRTGTTASGYPYKIYEDGSGGVDGPASKWSIDCQIDKISDKRKCNIMSTDADIFIDYQAFSVPQQVCILGHDFPGRVGVIRVDKNVPMTTNQDGCVGGSFAAQLRKGSEVTIRAVKWPYDYNRDKTSSIAGLSDAMDLVAHIQKNITQLSF